MILSLHLHILILLMKYMKVVDPGEMKLKLLVLKVMKLNTKKKTRPVANSLRKFGEVVARSKVCLFVCIGTHIWSSRERNKCSRERYMACDLFCHE